MTGGYRGLREVRRGYRGLEVVIGVYKGLQHFLLVILL